LATEGAVSAAVRSVRSACWLRSHGRNGRAALAATRSAEELDGLLLRPLARQLGDRPLVLVPTGALHVVPWAELPSCAGRAVTVAPSVSSWLRAIRLAREADTGERVWIAGPGLANAEAEVLALRAKYGGRALSGAAALRTAALSAMDGAGLVHVAAHGRFREDRPEHSSIELADGPLHGYDVCRLRTAPRRIVLASCESGLSVARPGAEVLGLAAELLRLGTATVLASVLPVPDDRALAVVAALHDNLAAGQPPAAALAAAQQAEGQLGFICLGAG
jgi:CHAT domain-containing protein